MIYALLFIFWSLISAQISLFCSEKLSNSLFSHLFNTQRLVIMSATTNRKVIDIDWVNEHIVQQIPDECLQKTPKLREAVEKWQKTEDFSVLLPSVSKCDGSLSSAKFVYANDSFRVDLSVLAKFLKCSICTLRQLQSTSLMKRNYLRSQLNSVYTWEAGSRCLDAEGTDDLVLRFFLYTMRKCSRQHSLVQWRSFTMFH